MDIFKKAADYDKMDEHRKNGVYPYFRALESKQDVEVIMEGKRRIMLGSNNYLGLTVDPDVVEAGIKALETYGTGCSGSRFLNGTLDMHLQLEKKLADFLGKESVMTFSTGFQSNLGIISAIVGRDDYVICDKENHASIYDGIKLSFGKMLRYKHNDMADLKKCLDRVPEGKGILIVTDGVFSMSGDIADLPTIVKLAKEYGARVMVDDAHGLGVVGKGGRGTASLFRLEKEVDIYMGTFSKSLASLGGYMAADEYVIDYVKHNSRPYIFSASITPVSCATAIAALDKLASHPELVDRLRSLSEYAREGYKKRGVALRQSNAGSFEELGNVPIPIIPIYTYTDERTLRVNKAIYENGVYVNPVISPAVPANECLLRTSYMASHTEALLDEAMDRISEVLSADK